MYADPKREKQYRDAMVIRDRFPEILPEKTPVHIKYWPARDLLTVLAGRQDRWSTTKVDGDKFRLYLDEVGAPVRVEIPAATRLFPRDWLQQHQRRRPSIGRS